MPCAADRRSSSARRRSTSRLALDALLVEQARDRLVVLGLEEAERQVLELPLDLPDAEPVGERREHLHRLGARARAGTAACSPRTSAASAGATPAAAAPRAGRARTRAASCARARSAAARCRRRRRARLCARALQLHRAFARAATSAAMRLAEQPWRHHLVGLAEVVGGVDQVGGGAQRRAPRRSRPGSRPTPSACASTSSPVSSSSRPTSSGSAKARARAEVADRIARGPALRVEQAGRSARRRRPIRRGRLFTAVAGGLHGEQQELPHRRRPGRRDAASAHGRRPRTRAGAPSGRARVIACGGARA